MSVDWKKRQVHAALPRLYGLFLGLLLAVPVPAVLPDIGDSAGTVVSPAQEYEMGAAFLRQLRGAGKVISDPELDDYIQGLGHRLSSMSEGFSGEFTFFIVDDPSINAFAAPGGFVGVHSGLILNAQNESELASVLAHEISHVTQHHLARAFEYAKHMSIPMMAAMLGAILVGITNPAAGQAAMAALQAGNIQGQINFTRSNEREADSFGIDLLARAGYDPYSMARFFERLQRANRYAGGANVPEFLRTHPVTESRIADALSRADSFSRRKYKDHLQFHLVRARLQVMALRLKPDRALRYYEDMLRSGKYPAEEVARYGYTEALINADQYGRARVQSDNLLRAHPERLAYLLQSARLNTADRRLQAAVEDYRRALKLYPNNRPATLGYARGLLNLGRAADAASLLRDYSYTARVGDAYYRLYAETLEKTGQTGESHMAMAEYYYRNGDTRLASAQLKLAKQAPGLDNYQRQRIEARLREFERELEADKKEEHS